jgi:hypothetical protein
MLLDCADGLNDHGIFFVGHGLDIRPGEIGEEAIGGNEAV